MRICKSIVRAGSLATLALAGIVHAENAAPAETAAAKPVLPTVSDLFDASGLTATGFVSGTFGYQTYSADSGTTVPADYSTFTLQQAAFTLSKLPTSGFGALVNVLAGQNIYTPNYGYYGISKTSTQVQIVQGYAQYATGPFTIIAGKFNTLAGAEVVQSVGNTNVTRSLLFSFEPITHTGARLTYAATGEINLIVGVNNGWIYSDELASSGGKTLEAGAAWTPSKAFSWTLQGYTGRDTTFAGVHGQHSLIDTVVTWNATSALTLIGTLDWGQVTNGFGAGSGSADWWGAAGYANYAINDLWRVSLRGEYFDDRKGYLTAVGPGIDQKLAEGTVTLGYAPTKNFEFRLEGRYDTYDDHSVKVAQGWLEALYKF